jgi:hypothetical protein
MRLATEIAAGDWEGGGPWWADACESGLAATLLAWPFLGGALVLRCVLHRRTTRPKGSPRTGIREK